MISECPKCGKREFVFKESEKTVLCCAACDTLICLSVTAGTGDIVSKLERVLDITAPGTDNGFNVVSMK